MDTCVGVSSWTTWIPVSVVDLVWGIGSTSGGAGVCMVGVGSRGAVCLWMSIRVHGVKRIIRILAFHRYNSPRHNTSVI